MGVQKVGEGWRGFRLPLMLIFKNLLNPPKGNFPPGMLALGSKGGSMTHEFMKTSFVPKILSRRTGGYFHSLSTLLLLDSASSHIGPEVESKMAKEHINCKIINGG